MFPKAETEVLYFDGENTVLAWVNINNEIFPFGYYCRNNDCTWISDDCLCRLTVNSEHYWMPLPNQPERLSEKTSKEDATV